MNLFFNEVLNTYEPVFDAIAASDESIKKISRSLLKINLGPAVAEPPGGFHPHKRIEYFFVRVQWRWNDIEKENFPKIIGVEVMPRDPLHNLAIETIDAVEQYIKPFFDQAGLAFPGNSIKPMPFGIKSCDQLTGWYRRSPYTKAHYYSFLQYGNGMPVGSSVCGLDAWIDELLPSNTPLENECKGCLQG
jgi:hypothetical protein